MSERIAVVDFCRDEATCSNCPDVAEVVTKRGDSDPCFWCSLHWGLLRLRYRGHRITVTYAPGAESLALVAAAGKR